MSTKTTLNSLLIQSIRKYCDNSSEISGEEMNNCLNINIRQSIVDYLTREKVAVSSKFILNLINGGLFSFDLWQLSDSNNFTASEISLILEMVQKNRQSLREVTLGGSCWIYNKKIVEGPLKNMFDGELPKLKSLKMQQIATDQDLLAVFNCCTRLRTLEISQPSITDKDINNIADRLKNCQVVNYLTELLLPSSLKSNSLIKLLAIFPNIQTLKCAPFEQLIELIDSLRVSDNPTEAQLAERAATTLSSLKRLTVTHPMGYDTIQRMVDMCPKLEAISLEIQDGMQLSPIANLQHLRNLQLRNSPTLPASYQLQVLPILQTKGKQLELLSLEQFDVIDLTTYAKLCPNLLSFSAQWFTVLGFPNGNMSSNLSSKVKNPFSNLRHIRLRPRSQRQIPSKACTFVLSHAKHLTRIELYCCYDLSDNDVQLLQSKNPMSCLRCLILRHGHNVTKEALNLLVSRAHQLSFIDCGTPPLKKGDQANDHLAPDP